MEARFRIITGFVAGALVGGAAGCQTYVFEPMTPILMAQTTQVTTVVGRQPDPNVMLVVDTSFSMNKPIHPSDPSCATLADPNYPGCTSMVCGYAGCAPCKPPCATRISELQQAMATILADAGTLAHFGLMELPKPGSGDQCMPSGVSDILVQIGDGGWSLDDDPTAMQAAAAKITTDIDAILPSGGTPTAATLQSLATGAAAGGAYVPLIDPNRNNYVFLLTDGEPNCNQNNPNDCTSAACECTLYMGSAPAAGSCPGAYPTCQCTNDPTNAYCHLGCIDTTAVVGAVTALRGVKVRTVVFGFGAETLADAGVGTGYAPGALNAMAMAGGFQRVCPNGTDAECNVDIPAGSPLQDTCDRASGTICADGTSYCCSRRYFAALDAAELEDAFKQIHIGGPVCSFVLEAVPSDPSLILVTIDGTDVPATSATGTVNWTYTAPSETNPIPVLTFQGATCSQLQSSTPANPVTVEIRVVTDE